MSLFTQQYMLTLRYWTSMSNILHDNARVQILMQTITKHTPPPLPKYACALMVHTHILSESKLSNLPHSHRPESFCYKNLFSFAYNIHTLSTLPSTTHGENPHLYLYIVRNFLGVDFMRKSFPVECSLQKIHLSQFRFSVDERKY